GDIVGINVNTMEVGGMASGSETDSGATNGIGMAMNGQYLYAGFTASNTIGTFQVQSDCSLSFVNDVAVVGLQAGFINGMAVHGNMLVATFGDGSIASFDISSGTPVSNDDEQNSTGYVKAQGTTYPNQVEITKDGHYAIFGDTSTSNLVEVSDLSSGKLNTTVVYPLGTTISSSNILLSPDETLLYVGNTQGAKITAAFFDKSTGKVTAGCASGLLRGYVSKWSYVASLALETNAGTGNTIYAAEFGGPSYLAIVGVSSSGGKCTLQEFPNSPVSESDSQGLLSIGVYPSVAF
ncbi:MAG: beta-propeller fold lactonase family protein, partial [Candidatus Sulfotelmatobacter sp.]